MKLRATPFALLAIAACGYTTNLANLLPAANASRAAPLTGKLAANQAPTTSAATPISDDSADAASGKKKILPPVAAEAMPAETRREQNPRAPEIARALETSYVFQTGRRGYLQVDKPLYKPGETIWFKVWDLKTRALDAAGIEETTVELISPKGASVLKKRLRVAAGMASNDFALPDEVQGGEYTLRATAGDGQRTERAIIVSGYEAPHMKKKLEFVKKAYGAGDAVSATLELKRPTGEVLANQSISAVITVDGVELPRVKATTNLEGAALIKFALPKTIETGEGLLTILVEDGGVTESVSKAIPILQKKLALAFFPEGGKMIAGLPTRLYFEANTLQGKPADVEGRLVDDLGHAVANFATYKNGLGRIDFTPATGRSYHAEVSRPSTITEKYALPLAEEKGCVLRHADDFDGVETAMRIQVRCSDKQKVIVAASVRDNLFDVASMTANSDGMSTLYLRAKTEAMARAAGVARVTLFDQDLKPLAERLVFRNRRARLQVQIEPNQNSFAPRGEVGLNLTTRDAAGKPVAAELALAVVDDTVISFADDKSGHLLSRLLLEPELPGKIEEPNFYLDLTEAQSAKALDLLMGTRGYRRFDWVPVLQPILQPNLLRVTGAMRAERQPARGAMPPPMPMAMPAPAAPPAPAPVQAPAKGDLRANAAKEAVAQRDLGKREPMQDQKQVAAGLASKVAKADLAPAKPVLVEAKRQRIEIGHGRVMAEPRAAVVAADEIDAANVMQDKDFARAEEKMAKKKMAPAPIAFAAVRVFPVPAFNPGYAGVRDDFRDTVFWAPSLKTGTDGKASVKFVLSDAVTSFRVVTEGVSAGAAGLAGRDETVFKSALPFSLSAKLPLEVSSGDKPLIPVTLTNDSNLPLNLALDANFGRLMRASGGTANQPGTLAPGARKSLFFPLEVLESHGLSQVRLSGSANGLKDEVQRSIPVASSGYPQLIEKSGQIAGQIAGQSAGSSSDKQGKIGSVEANGSATRAKALVSTAGAESSRPGETSFDVNLLKATPGSLQASIKVYTSPLSTMISGLEGMLREPGGCFEQTSSTNYPNVMIMQYLKQHDVADPALQEKSSRLLDSGYRELTGFESKNKGYEWFGGDPGHEALTAYGLLEFIDMKDVTGQVDGAMLARTANWLKSRRDGKGGYLRDPKGLDSFGRASPEVTNAYITWALVSAGETGLDAEIAQSARLAASSNDAYQLALATGTLLTGKGKPSPAGLQAAARLVAMQEASGAWTRADHSITRSGGLNLQIETTSLAVLALLQSGQHLESARKGINWLQNNRSGYGQWGATQATVLALKAMIAFDNATRVAPTSGSVALLIDGVKVAEQSYQAGQREPIVFTGFEDKLLAAPTGKGTANAGNSSGNNDGKTGANNHGGNVVGKSGDSGAHRITLRSTSSQALPWSMALEYRSIEPASAKQAVVDLSTRLAKSEMKMGETVRLDAVVTNKTQTGQPMTLARIGLPGGLSFQNWQLKELREKGQIAFFETRAREVILYFRDLKPAEVKKLAFDLVATVPGSYTAPASSGYLYYNDTDKTWAAPLEIRIAP